MTTPLAYEHNGRRIGREQFYAIACDPRRSVAVEACAGAGKTWMLVSRIVRALLEGAQPHQILAITFTKKAAGEMRQRLQDGLAAFAQATPEQLQEALVQRGVGPQPASTLHEPLRNLYRQLLDAGRPVQVRTFHSWFAALLRTAPLAVLERLGLPAHYELLEDDSEAVQRVWRRFFTAVAARPEARRDYEESVAAHGRSMTQKALLAALAKRVEFSLADAHGVVDDSVQPWQGVFPDWREAGTPQGLLAVPGPVHEALAAAARALGRALQATFSAKGAQLEQALAAADLAAAVDALLTQKGEPRKFNDKLAGIEAVRAAQALAVRLAQAADQHEAWLHHRRLARLARLLLEEFAALKRDQGWVDMNDVERAAQALLSDPVLSGWMQQRLDARIAHLLIDEFQDTNPLQWQALQAWLSGYAGAGGGAGADGTGAPSVFIVGDPKQSIYRFRRAEPQVFRAAQAFVREGLDGELLSCDHTHRNAPAVMDVVNAVMRSAQDAGQYEGFRDHTTQSREPGAVACLPAIERTAVGGAGEDEDSGEHAPAGVAWRDSLTVPRELPEEKLLTLECRQAAGWIARRLAAGTAPHEVMVLARRRDRLVAMEAELRALGISAQQPEKTDLAEAPEVQDLVALLDVLVSPTHDLSLARALKSPLFGVPDDALVELALCARRRQAEGAPVPWLELLQKEELTAPSLKGLGTVLLRWKGWVDRLPPHDALDAIYHQGDVLARFAQAAPCALREATLANLRALLGAALEVGGARYATPYALVRALKAGGVPGPALADAAAVRLLTVHGAKGLEADLVLLLDTDAPPPRAETMGVIVEWPGEAPAPRRFAFLASQARPPSCCAEALQVELAARHREELNALYVAMTRARRELVVSSVQPHLAAEGSWWQRLQPLATPLAAPEVDAGGAATSASQAAAEPFQMLIVPVAGTDARPPAMEKGAARPATAGSLFGQALHRLLELRPADGTAWPGPVLQRVAREFALAPAQLDDATAMAARILAGEGAWAWDIAVVAWHGNEVELHHGGELLRLDRLVRRHDGAWWVLDFKSAARPEGDAALLAQLRRYRQAVQACAPGEPVHAAFLTGQGRLVRVE